MRQMIRKYGIKSDELSWEGCSCHENRQRLSGNGRRCFRWAREAHKEEVRESYIQLAQIWLNAASLIDGPPPIRIAPPEMPTKAA